ncbi:ABC transporter permease [Alkalihalobacillus sp. 1P02AB]|uniref:ABC transporter permease n=1 Tax=Alkalihalobacillus sp. 1P02AB TaxID=3132260 RepID=UPI0039A76CCD
MFFALIKKDLKLILHDRMELLVLLLMPVVLIGILGVAIGNIGGSEDRAMLHLAIVEEEDLQESLSEYKEILESRGLESNQIRSILEEARAFSIPEILREDVFTEEEFMVQLTEELSEEEAINSGLYDGIFIVERGYRLAFWDYIFFRSGELLPLAIKVNENPFYMSIIEQMMNHFFLQIHFEVELASLKDHFDLSLLNEHKNFKEEIVVANRLISGFDYYAVGMVTMFVLFGTSFIASYAMTEKFSHIFMRLKVANLPFIYYMLTKWLSSFIIAFLQISIIFTFCYFVYQVSWDNIGLFLIVTSCLSLMVGGMTTVLTAINFLTNSYRAVSAFSYFGVALLAFIGGSFGYIHSYSPILANLAGVTPNGVAMEGYFVAMVGGTLNDISSIFPTVIFFSFFCFVVSLFIFSRRGDVQ